MNQKSKLLELRGADIAKTYECWVEMRRRIAHPFRKGNGKNYANITICEEWESFDRFLQDMGTSPKGYSLDRIDCSKGYYKENCRWADAVMQAQNRLYCKINHESAMNIRIIYAIGFSQQVIANMYNVSQRLISLIVRFETWERIGAIA